VDILKKLRISGRKSLVPNILKTFGKPVVPRTEAVLVKRAKKAKKIVAVVKEPKVEVVKVELPKVPAQPAKKVKVVEEPKVVAPVVVSEDNKPFFEVYDLSDAKRDIPARVWARLERSTVGEAKALFVEYKPFIDASVENFNLESYRRK